MSKMRIRLQERKQGGFKLIKQHYDDGKKHIHVLSYGGGTQSTALLLMALRGEVNGVQPDYIIFSDTGWEPKHIYDQVEKINAYIKKEFGREIIYTSGGNLKEDLIRAAKTGSRVASLPYHTLGNPEEGKKAEGMAMRQCTGDYKVEPVKKKVRELLGYKPRERVKEVVHMWKGISSDEIQRVKPIMRTIKKNGKSEQVPCTWRVAEHPLVEVLSVDRSHCIAYVEKLGLGTMYGSSCVGCPFHDNHMWLEIKQKDPKGFEEACDIDDMLREGLRLKNKVFLHKSRKPLREVDLQEDQTTIFDDFTNECSGFCGL
jgi:hypothetical protein